MSYTPTTDPDPTMTTITAEAVAVALADHIQPGPLDDVACTGLAKLIADRGHTLTGLARKMDKPHTWLLRKLDMARDKRWACSAEDAAEVLTFLGASPQDILAACA